MFVPLWIVIESALVGRGIEMNIKHNAENKIVDLLMKIEYLTYYILFWKLKYGISYMKNGIVLSDGIQFLKRGRPASI